jgi:hypothetical protein
VADIDEGGKDVRGEQALEDLQVRVTQAHQAMHQWQVS